MKILLFELLSDIVKVENVLFVVKSDGATSEVRTPLSIRQKEKWITLGENDDPAHIHVDSELISHAEFIQEEKSERTSFSVRLYNRDNHRVLAAFFTKMYDDSKILIPERKKMYDKLNQKFSSKINFKKNLV